MHRLKGVWAGQGRDESPWELARAPARRVGLAEKEPHSWSVQCVPVISALLVVRLGSGASHACAPEGSQIWTSLNQPSSLTANDWHSRRTSHLLAILHNPTAATTALLSLSR